MYKSKFTGLEVDHSVFNASLLLNLSQPEPIVGDGSYKSPTQYVQYVPNIDPVNFEYSGGQATYIGDEDITVMLIVTTSVKSGSGGVGVTMTGGKNGTPALAFETLNVLSNANDVKELTSQSVEKLSKNDTLDFYIKANANITMENAIFNVFKIG